MGYEADRPFTLYFVRHGVTEPNFRGFRCGGDLDLPLMDIGCDQAYLLAKQIDKMNLRIGVIIAGSLLRTRQTASIISGVLGEIPIVVEPLINERRLGEWNNRPIAETEEQLARMVEKAQAKSAQLDQIVGRIEITATTVPEARSSSRIHGVRSGARAALASSTRRTSRWRSPRPWSSGNRWIGEPTRDGAPEEHTAGDVVPAPPRHGRRATASISMRASRTRSVTPMQVRLGRRPSGKNVA